MNKVILIIITMSFYSMSFAADVNKIKLLTDTEKVEIIWEKYLDESLEALEFYSITEQLELKTISISDQLRIHTIKKNILNIKSIKRVSVLSTIKYEEALKIASEWKYIGSMTGSIAPRNLSLINKAKKYLKSLLIFRNKTKEELRIINTKKTKRVKLHQICIPSAKY